MFEKNEIGILQTMPEIYGFSGKLGTGKNYVAERLFARMLPPKNTLVMALADHFKVDAVAKDRIEYHRIFMFKDQESRQLLQKRGTEEGRDRYGDDVWLRTLETWIQTYQGRGVERFIITDLRFPNEVQWLKSLGGKVLRMNAPHRNRDRHLIENSGTLSTHPSEISLDDYDEFDYIIENDYDNKRQVPNRIRDIVRELTMDVPVPVTIFLDMDDTICQCSCFYRDTTRVVLDQIKEVNPFISEETMEQLVQKHIMSFEHRYYTRDDFALSLQSLVREATTTNTVGTIDLSEQAYQMGLKVYDNHYDPLYDDSIKMVREIQKIGRLVIFTLGDHTEQMKKIVHLGLHDLPVEIFTHKDPNMFRYLKHKYPSRQYVMIGDSYQRDIVPAHQAGITNLVHITNKQMVYSEIEPTLQVTRLNNDLLEFVSKI